MKEVRVGVLQKLWAEFGGEGREGKRRERKGKGGRGGEGKDAERHGFKAPISRCIPH